jgi:L-iditol 2-dehydrogenase
MSGMTALMKVAKGPGNVELREVDVPVPGPDEVLVEVRHVGICGSDLHIARDTHPNHPPVILGHEFSGIVATVGHAADGWQIGDRVVSELHGGACGQCRLCKTGNVFACPNKRPIGWWTNGAYADYIRVPARLLHRVPDALPLVEAALTEPLAACLNVLQRTPVAPQSDVVVVGPGPRPAGPRRRCRRRSSARASSARSPRWAFTRATSSSPGATPMSVPVMAIALFFQRFLVDGLTAGAVKG